MSTTKKGNPIPTKFDQPEEELILALNEQTGLSQGEIIRRAVRLLRMEIQKRGNRIFLFEELGPQQTAIAAEEPGHYVTGVQKKTVRQIERAAKRLRKTKGARPRKKSAA